MDIDLGKLQEIMRDRKALQAAVHGVTNGRMWLGEWTTTKGYILSPCLFNFYAEYIILFMLGAAATAKSLQSCPTLCDPIDGSPPGSSVPRILQARLQEWVAISSSNAWKWKVKVKSLSGVWLLATPWTATYQAPPPMGFAGRNINNLRYADDTTLMAESEKELKNLLMKVKEESEKPA